MARVADMFSLRVFDADVKRALTRIDRSVERATMFGLRETGRKVKQGARRAAPVYQGSRADVPKGRLKKSISSSRNLRRYGAGGFGVSVAPRGYPAAAYAGKREAETHFMEHGYEQGVAEATGIYARAWEKAMRRR